MQDFLRDNRHVFSRLMIQEDEDDETSSEDESHPFRGWAPFSHSGISDADEHTSDDDDLEEIEQHVSTLVPFTTFRWMSNRSVMPVGDYMRLLVRNLYEEDEVFDSMRYYDPNDIPPQPLPQEKLGLVLQPLQVAQTQQRCCICLEECGDAPGSRGLPCGHAFHTSCITQWFAQSSGCPVCRTDFSGYTPPPPPSPTPPPKTPKSQNVHQTHRRRRR